jgi:hypothetical protein
MRGITRLTAVVFTVAAGAARAQQPKVELSAWHTAVKTGDLAEVKRQLAIGQDQSVPGRCPILQPTRPAATAAILRLMTTDMNGEILV